MLSKAIKLTQNLSYDRALPLLQQHFEMAYADNYSISEIRKALRQGIPILIPRGSETVWIVGEDRDTFVLRHNGQAFEIPEKTLMKAWTGKATMLIEETQKSDEPESIWITASERDSWSTGLHDVKSRTLYILHQIDSLPSCMLPIHPVILLFRDQSERPKDHVKAKTEGVEITIYSSENPVEEALHELGHVYAMTRLINSEKMALDALSKNLKSMKLPAIFGATAKWNWQTGEELFCQLYCWRLRGALNPAYLKILKHQYPAGLELLNRIFARVKEMETWRNKESEFLDYLKSINGEPIMKAVSTGDHRRIRMSPKRPEGVPLVPHMYNFQSLSVVGDREWVRINGGKLNDEVLILHKGRMDYDTMEKQGTRKIPVLERRTNKNGRPYTVRLMKAVSEFPVPVESVDEPVEPDGSWIGRAKKLFDHKKLSEKVSELFA